jgi:hypothetical protein
MNWTPHWLAQEVIGGWVGAALSGLGGVAVGAIAGWWRRRSHTTNAAAAAAKRATEEERAALAKQFYSGIHPVMQRLAALRNDHNVPAEPVRQVVEAIANDLAVPMFGSVESLVMPAVLQRPPGTIGDCGVCGGEAKYQGNACDRCGLDCFAWDFKMPRTNSVETQQT